MSGARRSRTPVSTFFLLVLLFFTVSPSPCLPEVPTTIESESLEYERGTSTFTVKGRVTITQGEATVKADEIVYNDETSEATATGNVVYEDPSVVIKANTAELNLSEKTGKLHEAVILSKKDQYRVTGIEIEKTGENEYTLKEASFTTCDAPIPPWCFRGKDVDVTVGDRLTAKDVTFNILGKPILYTPYLSTSIDRDRKTGFLFPYTGYAESKGFHYQQPLFWAISENRDATFVLDAYTDRGIGQGLEYRFIEQDGSKGRFWAYHLKDEELDKNFWQLQGVYDRNRQDRITGYLALNYINRRQFYDEYHSTIISETWGSLDSSTYLTYTTERFLESTGEVSFRFADSRLFLTPRYLIDLNKDADQSTVPQRLPEAGFFVNPRRVGPLVFSLNATVANYWREEGAFGQRLDLSPRFLYSFGDDIVITQALGLRETAYSLHGSDEFGSSPHREGLDYSITAHTRFMKRYGSFTHIVEPSLGYTFIPPTESDLPLFDSTEVYPKTSLVELSFLNRFVNSSGEFLTVRVSEAYNANVGDRPFSPLVIEAALKQPFTLRTNAAYNVYSGELELINADMGFSLSGLQLAVGERYNAPRDILSFSGTVQYALSQSLSVEGSFLYNAKDGGLDDLVAKLKYQKQCWGSTLVFVKRDNDYSISVLFDLLGVGTIKF